MNTPDTTPNTPATRDAAGREAQPALLPPVDVVEDAGAITLWADLPGVTREGLNLQVDGDQLAIEGEVTLQLPEGMQASHAEVGVNRYRRVFTLSKELDTQRIEANLNQGVLQLRIPKAEHARPRRIEVQAA
ncbi:Hsp20/alpha crystallin family protein [Xenophilus sp.]|jgi:HSP20 family molecular chaperone IbpA|uniref:Hsp20/alpha crystallin family protein n=1 Tax=Xenophilus sp. TaxID=1873499 RepID=UPI0037DCFB3A